MASVQFEKLSNLRMMNDEINRLLDLKLQEFYLALVRIYPGFDSMPEPAKISLFDMIYNLGTSGVEFKFPHFTKSVRARDWQSAAAQCLRPQLPGARNSVTMNRFLTCAGLVPTAVTPPPKTAQSLQKPVPSAPASVSARSFAKPPFFKPIAHPDRIVRSAVIKAGDKGADVLTAQNALNRLLVGNRPMLKLDGVFGPHVVQAVRFVQNHAGLPADGQIGARTRSVIDLVLA